MNVRILNDVAGTEDVLHSDIERPELWARAKQLRRDVKDQQDLFKLCLHATADTVTLHWYTNDEKFARAICDAVGIVDRTTVALARGRVKL